MPASDPEEVRRPIGKAYLDFELASGRTRLARSETSPPLLVQRTLYLDEMLPDMAFVHLMNPTAGVFDGDLLEVKVRTAEGARAHVATQSATKVHSMVGSSARQIVELDVGSGSCLEYMPDPVILFRGARYSQELKATVQTGATLLVMDVLSPGRIAFGESYRFERFETTLHVQDGNGLPLFHESFRLEPLSMSPFRPGIIGEHSQSGIGTLLAICDSHDTQHLRDAVRRAMMASTATACGVTELAGARGIVARILDERPQVVNQVLHAAWKALRLQLLGADLPRTPKN